MFDFPPSRLAFGEKSFFDIFSRKLLTFSPVCDIILSAVRSRTSSSAVASEKQLSVVFAKRNRPKQGVEEAAMPRRATTMRKIASASGGETCN